CRSSRALRAPRRSPPPRARRSSDPASPRPPSPTSRASATGNTLCRRQRKGAGEVNAVAGPGLTRVVHDVRELALGERTSYDAGRLTVGEQRVRDLLRDPALGEVRLAC